MKDIEITRQRLVLYLKAERDILQGQRVEVEGMSLTRADLNTVRIMIASLRKELDQYAAKNSARPRKRLKVVIPR